MKKIIFGAFAVAFAFSMQAVQITWTCGPLYIPDAGTREFLYADSEFEYYEWTAYFSGTPLTSGASAIITVSEGTSGVTPFTYSYGDTGFSKGGILGGKTADDLPASTDNLLATIVVTYDSWSMTTSGSFNTTGAAGAADLTFGGPWTMIEKVPIIPEPATMALLGIGVVAVGLRRRRK